MIKITPLVLTGVVGIGLHLYKTQTNEVAAEASAPKSLSLNGEMAKCIRDAVAEGITEADRKNKDGTEKTAEEMEETIDRKVNDILWTSVEKNLHPIRSACLVKFYDPNWDAKLKESRERANLEE